MSDERFSGQDQFKEGVGQEEEEWRIQAIRLRKMVSHLPSGAVFVENSKLFVNRAAEKIVGYTGDELSSRDLWFQKLYGDRSREVRALYEECRKEGFPENVVAKINRSDGEERVVEFSAHGFDDHEVWFLNDITEAEKGRLKLAEEERRHRAILNAANDAIITIDKKGIIVSANPAVEKLFAYREEEILGKNVKMLMPSPDQEQHDQYIENYHRTGIAKVIGIGRETIACRKDGTHFPIELSISRVEGLGLFTGFIRDISVRKAATDALQYELEYKNAIIDSAETVILILGLDGNIIRFNPYFENISGRRSKDVEGVGWIDKFIADKDQNRIKRLFQGMFDDEIYPHSVVFPIRTKKGKEVHIDWSFAPLPEVNGQISGVLCTGIDVTEKLGLELQVIQVTEEERRRVANELHDGVGSLLTGIDFRTQALVKELSQNDMLQAEEARVISKQIREAIIQIRAISSGLHPVGAHPDDLVMALKELTSKIFLKKGLTYRFRCSSSIRVENSAQANHLYRIAQEAVNNSIKHSDCSHITASLEQKDNSLVLKVLDNGIGYKQEAARVGGLGLHSMDYRARAMNGNLRIRGRKEGGTEVLCIVPIS